MKISKTDLVLEIGSGNRPYPRADVLVDLLPEDNAEREEEKEIVIDRPFVVAKGEQLPFRDKAFDYVIASHVLEHSADPDKFLKEIQRVGKRGYIETPSSIRERIYNWSFHRYYVELDHKRLILVRKTVRSQEFASGLTAKIRDRVKKEKGLLLPNTVLEWVGTICYQIFKQEPKKLLKKWDREILKYDQTNYRFSKVRSVLFRIKNMLYPVKKSLSDRLNTLHRRNVRLYTLLVCPYCKGHLKYYPKQMHCDKCDRTYDFYQRIHPKFI